MSRVDLEVDGERVAAENFSDPSNVTIALDGGDREVFTLADWEHVVVNIDEDADDEGE